MGIVKPLHDGFDSELKGDFTPDPQADGPATKVDVLHRLLELRSIFAKSSDKQGNIQKLPISTVPARPESIQNLVSRQRHG